MSDTEFSPPKTRIPFHSGFNDIFFKESEPKCVNSLCNLINTRLKLLESEIVAQHKAWEYIQREVDEVKSLIEDCASTCDSSSLSGQENDSEIVDSALESHKTCNSVLWDKIKQAEENLEEKKSLIQLLSSDVSRLKNAKKNCKRKSEKASSNIDLILDVTNGLHVLKCDHCKFCSEHLDFREGLLSSVIELVHFCEKNYSSCHEENKVLKGCLQKIHLKIKKCFFNSQLFVRNSGFHHSSFDVDHYAFSADNIYSSFEEFCSHFQTLQEELMQLKHILVAAEESHLDDVFQSSHSLECRCFNNSKKNERRFDADFSNNGTKFSKSNEKNSYAYEKKIKSLNCCDEIENAVSDSIYEANQIFGARTNADKQLEILRSRIFNAVRIIRDVEMEESDDENIISMVTSLSEECSALRQEVSYLRNVRQEKKRAWNKLQCFIMDSERKLKGSQRNITCLREVISELGQLIATSESSSLDETILYMYSNQLEWLEKNSMGCESPSDVQTTGRNTHLKDVICHESSSTQTLSDFDWRGKNGGFQVACDIATQTENVSWVPSIHPHNLFESSFQEINREIYVVPEVLEESDSGLASFNESIAVKEVETPNLNTATCSSDTEINNLLDCQIISCNENSNIVETVLPSASIFQFSGSFPENMNIIPRDRSRGLQHTQDTNQNRFPFFKMSDITFTICNEDFSYMLGEEAFDFLNFSDVFFSLFLNSKMNIEHVYNSVYHNLLKDDVKSIEIRDEENNLSCLLYKSKSSPLNISCEPIKPLPYSQFTNVNQDECEVFEDNVKVEENLELYSHIEDDFNAKNSFSNFSSMPKETELLPKNEIGDSFEAVMDDDSANFSATALESSLIDHLKDECTAEDSSLCSSNEATFTLERSGTFICEKPTSACREGTFIIDSGDKLHLNKSKACDENLYFTAILTALKSNDSIKSEKDYVLYEVCNSFKNSMVVVEDVNPYSVSNFDKQISSEQHFILCETDEENIDPETFSSKIFCHMVFLKTHLIEECSIEKSDISGFYPLLPRYLPSENYNYGSFEHVSLMKNCEIYMCKSDDCKEHKDTENIAFIPKNYFKFKEAFSSQSSDNSLLQENASLQFEVKKDPSSFTSPENSDCSNIDLIKAKHFQEVESSNSNIKNNYVVSLDKDVQVDETFDELLEDPVKRHKKLLFEFHEMATQTSEDTLNTDSAIFSSKTQDYGLSENLNKKLQDQVVREISLLDENDALKENLRQQNAVLIRLKEELEESNYNLAEKEQLLLFLQLEHSRLNTLLTENGVKEIDEKESQTDSNGIVFDSLEKEVRSLRQKNVLHYEKIVHQNDAIQSVKSQLSSTIAHLKHLKDAATKQFKKQKHHVLKSAKLKQQLQETKAELGKKIKDLEQKNELVSHQEFLLIEVQRKLDSTATELMSKSKTPLTTPHYEKLDFGCQATIGKSYIYDTHKRNSSPKADHEFTLKKHSEELMELKAQFNHLESMLSNKKEFRLLNDDVNKSTIEQKYPFSLKEGNIWKLLTVSEQSYLNLLNKLSEALQISDLKGASVLMHSSWLNCEDLADARRQDHKKILQSLEKMKRNIRYLQETINLEPKRQNVELTDERKSSFMCHSDEMHLQYLCEVLQKAQESLVKEYSQKRTSHRSIVTAGSGRTSRYAGSREKRIPLELKNGKILAMLDDKLNHKELLPSKFDYDKMECKSGYSSTKSKTPT